MTDDELAQRYADAARRHGEANAQGDWGLVNRTANVISDTLKILRQRPDKGQAILEPMLDTKEASIRVWAATHYLPIDEARATSVLEFLSKMRGSIGFSAKMVLQEWLKGNLRT